jgi:DNA-binding MarR family transcriptional regulator
MKTVTLQIETLPFLVESLKRDIRDELNLSWSEFLILSRVKQFDQHDEQPSPQQIIESLRMNRGWIYGGIKRLTDEGHLKLQRTKPFTPGRRLITLYGKSTLRRIEMILGRGVQGF